MKIRVGTFNPKVTGSSLTGPSIPRRHGTAGSEHENDRKDGDSTVIPEVTAEVSASRARMVSPLGPGCSVWQVPPG